MTFIYGQGHQKQYEQVKLNEYTIMQSLTLKVSKKIAMPCFCLAGQSPGHPAGQALTITKTHIFHASLKYKHLWSTGRHTPTPFPHTHVKGRGEK